MKGTDVSIRIILQYITVTYIVRWIQLAQEGESCGL